MASNFGGQNSLLLIMVLKLNEIMIEDHLKSILSRRKM